MKSLENEAKNLMGKRDEGTVDLTQLQAAWQARFVHGLQKRYKRLVGLEVCGHTIVVDGLQSSPRYREVLFLLLRFGTLMTIIFS